MKAQWICIWLAEKNNHKCSLGIASLGLSMLTHSAKKRKKGYHSFHSILPQLGCLKSEHGKDRPLSVPQQYGQTSGLSEP
jgi:hypothetical protein